MATFALEHFRLNDTQWAQVIEILTDYNDVDDDYQADIREIGEQMGQAFDDVMQGMYPSPPDVIRNPGTVCHNTVNLDNQLYE